MGAQRTPPNNNFIHFNQDEEERGKQQREYSRNLCSLSFVRTFSLGWTLLLHCYIVTFNRINFTKFLSRNEMISICFLRKCSSQCFESPFHSQIQWFCGEKNCRKFIEREKSFILSCTKQEKSINIYINISSSPYLLH